METLAGFLPEYMVVKQGTWDISLAKDTNSISRENQRI